MSDNKVKDIEEQHSNNRRNDFDDITQILATSQKEVGIDVKLDIMMKEMCKLANKLKSQQEEIEDNNKRIDEYLQSYSRVGRKLNTNEYDFENKGYELVCNLKTILADKGITQAELSQLTNIKLGTLRDIMRKPEAANGFNMLKIALALKMNINEIFVVNECK